MLIMKHLSILFDFIVNDFRSRYVNNSLGGIWAFIQPAITILIFWFVFTVGFKSAAVGGTPFILWLISGMIPWFFLSESISQGTNAVVENDYLVKKIVFRVEMLSVVKIATAFAMHLVFVVLVMVIFLLYDYQPALSWLQLFYYLGASIPLLLGITWITSSVLVFFRDMGQIVAMAIQFGFWLTPIFWSIDTVPQEYRTFLELNPANYIVQGYRDSFIGGAWFWEKPFEGLVYWGIALSLLVGGRMVFKRLRPHFADVL